MKQSKWTPGPWEAEIYNYLDNIWVVKAGNGYFRGNAVSDMGEANARLIAAAPELVEACKMAFANLGAIAVSEETFNLIRDTLNNAINKAEGR